MSVLLCTACIILLGIGFNLSLNKLDNLDNQISDYKSKLTQLKEKIFTKTNLNDREISYDRSNNINTPAAINQNNIITNGALVNLEDNILRRMYHTDTSGTLVNMTDANTKYDNLRQTDAGIDTLIGYIQFSNNSDDYKLLQEALCGTSICSTSGIGSYLKKMESRHFTEFKDIISAALKTNPELSSTYTSPDPIPSYTTFIQNLQESVSKYDVGFAKFLQNPTLSLTTKDLNDIIQITDKNTLPNCDCNGNPLNLELSDKRSVLSNLNYLGNLSNGDNSKDIMASLYKFQSYLIVSYIFITYFVFHLMYRFLSKKLLIGGYIGILLTVAIILGLIGRLS
jgi:hypothetical protein